MSWTPSWTSEEKKELKDLQKRNEHREKELTKIFGTDTRPHKWYWRNEFPKAAKLIEYAQEDATRYKGLVQKELTKLYTWPNLEMTDDHFFTPGKGIFATFDREENWFKKMGFYEYQTHYTFSDSWDKEMMPVKILVPNDLPVGHKAPVMWFFHGGGYYKEDGCFESGFTKWTEWLYKQIPVQNFTIDKDHVYVEGESAGGQAAVTALWLNAAEDGPNLPIDVALLRYPMIAHYKRRWDKIADKDGKVNYMGVCFTKKDVMQREANITDLTKWLESHSLVPTCSSRWPSVGMAFAFILSVTERWQWYFQRQHSLPKAKRDELDYMDGIERANNTQASVLHQLLPPIYIFHGWNDPNCPIDNTQEFVRVLETKYPNDTTTIRICDSIS
ncbi:unnamed protein product [Alternaria alternata]